MKIEKKRRLSQQSKESTHTSVSPLIGNRRMAVAMNEEKKQLQLPNDVLGYILWKLNLREATRSILVSRDWRYAWSHGVTDLDFDASWKFRTYEKDSAGWYVGWVNRVIESLPVEHIHRFRVNFALTKRWAEDIDRWLAFAFDKRVKSLEFDFSNMFIYLQNFYPFPNISDPIERLRIFPSNVHVYSSITNLQSLSLMYVQVSSQALEFFLSNCPVLEQLCLRCCGEFIDLRISGSSLPLKHLQIYESFLSGGFEIDAPNLSSFECDDTLNDEFKFGNTQKLTKLTIPASSFLLGNFCRYTPQLEELVIVYNLSLFDEPSYFEGVELLRLKRAELRFLGHATGKSILHTISNLLHAVPHLDMLKIDFGPCMLDDDDEFEFKFSNTQKLTKLTIPASPSFLGNFCRYTPQLEELVIMYNLSLFDEPSYFEGVELHRLKRAKLRFLEHAFYTRNNILHIISNVLHVAPHLDMLKIDFGPKMPNLHTLDDDDEEDDDIPTCHKHAFLKTVEIRCSNIKRDYPKEAIREMRKALKQLARKLRQKLPSRAQLLLP